MSWNQAPDPDCPESSDASLIEQVIVPRPRDLGGFSVRRALPSAKRRMVGPFIFLDQMGPADFRVGQGIDVRPHPHIGIATVTYLFDGEFQHRDSLGTDQMIYPGEVNWMIAGRGITHSERTSQETRQGSSRLFGIQTWVALPAAHEETAPAFEHHGKEALPFLESAGKRLRLILGTAYGAKAPVKTFSQIFYADAELDAGATLVLPEEHEERGLYIVEGAVAVGGALHEAGRLLVFETGRSVTVAAGPAGARLMLLGGERLPEKRYIWWNFVSTSEARIASAREDWRQGRFALPPTDDQEFTPLPETWVSSAADD